MTMILPKTSVSPLRQKLIDDMTMRHFSALACATRLSMRMRPPVRVLLMRAP